MKMKKARLQAGTKGTNGYSFTRRGAPVKCCRLRRRPFPFPSLRRLQRAGVLAEFIAAAGGAA
jgi:hypothetical protein